MDSHKLILKFYAQDTAAIDMATVVPVFHAFIQQQALPDHLLIDVADYAHVHEGPGIVLAAHEANLYLDEGEGRPGLMYQRKQPLPGTHNLRDRLAPVFAATLRACARLEDDPAFAGRLRFRTDEVMLRINDRLLAPNTPETFRTVEPDLRAFLSDLYPGEAVTLEPRYAELTLFEVRIRAEHSTPVKDLLERLEALPATSSPA